MGIAGVLLLYCEFIWIGRIYFGVAGAALLLLGVRALWNLPLTGTGLCLVAAAMGCFLVEAIIRNYFIAGILGTVALGIGIWTLCPKPLMISPAIGLPVSAVFGAITIALLSVAKKARWNKRAV